MQRTQYKVPKVNRWQRAADAGRLGDMQARHSRRLRIPDRWSGGGLDISIGVGMMYSASYRLGQVYLDVVALMHHRHVYSDGSQTHVPQPPPGAIGGCGASIGPYMVICHYVNGRNELYAEGQFLVDVEDSNVVLLEQAGPVPRIFSMHKIDDDLNGVAWRTIVDVLRERLYQLPEAPRFISSEDVA